ncbi:MAG TPA: signal peptide peptidase SppA [Panacibacter sp.]|nr:signal peptide peptidase SppA [Panacibacter sp.]
MKSFIKLFFASFLALVIFCLIVFFIGIWFMGSALRADKPDLGSKGVLLLDLSTTYNEQGKDNPLASLTGNTDAGAPGLYDMVRMLHYAKTDTAIKGLYIKAGYNGNGFATSEELRKAVVDFKESKKFVIAYGEAMDQKSYFVSTAADKVYCHPNGGIDWDGFSLTTLFMKGLLDKLGIEPQVFFAGKFKSATETFRVTKMTDANRLQTTDLLNDLYAGFLLQTSKARNIDTAALHLLAINGSIRTAYDAEKYKLVDGLRYDDEVKAEILKKLSQKKTETINFISFSKYAKAVDFTRNGDDKIAIIYAQGDITGGKGSDDEIGSDNFVSIIRKARLDKDVKAIVFRVNSPGGSSLASDAIWREITLAKEDKPVVVSMGDYAASGGYYISCNADSIFADEGTLTGSIGVFSILPNMQPFFNDKLGITFDGVKTAPYADMGSTSRPLTGSEKRFLQASVDSIYFTFKTRVANGRTKDIGYIDSIAQGHVYTGLRAIPLALVDKTGTLQDAVDCAARMAKTSNYYTKEYPEKKSFFEQLAGSSPFSVSIKEDAVIKNIGAEQYSMLEQIKKIQELMKTPQARLPFSMDIR